MPHSVSGIQMISRKRTTMVIIITVICAMSMMVSAVSAQEIADPVVYSGKVVFGGQPVEGAEIYILRRVSATDNQLSTTEMMSRSGKDGSFSIIRPTDSDIIPLYGIIAKYPGYASGGTMVFKATEPDNITIELFRPTYVSGTIQSTDGEPLENVDVIMEGYEFHGKRFNSVHFYGALTEMNVLTERNGQYTIENVPIESEVIVTVRKSGYVEDLVTTRAGVTDNYIYLETGGMISGMVTDGSTGAPVGNIHVEARSQDPGQPGSGYTVTEEDGRYVIDGLRSGSYRVTLSPNENLTGIARPVESVIVSPANTTTDVNFAMTEGIPIRGIVTDKITGKPVAGSKVSAIMAVHDSDVRSYEIAGGEPRYSRPSDIFTASVTHTDSTGWFQATALPGHVFLHILKPEIEQIVGSRVTTEHLYIEPNVTPYEIHSAITREVSKSGTVFLPDGSPAANVILGEFENTAVSDKNGMFTVYELMPGRTTTIPARREKLHLEGSVVIDTSSDDPIEVHLWPYRYTSVSGKVIDEQGAPVQNEPIELYWSESLANENAAVSGPDGSFTVDSLRVGQQYSLAVGGHQSVSPVFIAGDMSEPVALVRKNADRWIAGRVVNENGDPVPQAFVFMYSNESGNRYVFTDGDGRFRIEHLIPNTENFSIRALPYGIYRFNDIPTNTDREYIVNNQR